MTIIQHRGIAMKNDKRAVIVICDSLRDDLVTAAGSASLR